MKDLVEWLKEKENENALRQETFILLLRHLVSFFSCTTSSTYPPPPLLSVQGSASPYSSVHFTLFMPRYRAKLLEKAPKIPRTIQAAHLMKILERTSDTDS